MLCFEKIKFLTFFYGILKFDLLIGQINIKTHKKKHVLKPKSIVARDKLVITIFK